MVDIVIKAQVEDSDLSHLTFKSYVWKTTLIGYAFYNLTDSSGSFVYSKTTNGGLTWATEVVIQTQISQVPKFAVWADWQTPGDSGELIHITYWTGQTPSIVAVKYRNLDTSTDILGSQIQVVNGNSVSTLLLTWDGSIVDIVKARGGGLHIAYWTHNVIGPNQGRGHFVSTDGGLNWVNRAQVADGDPVDRIYMVPGNEADPDDIWCFYQDVSADLLTLKVWDATGNSWSESATINAINDRFTNMWMIAAAPRHSDLHTILFISDDYGNADTANGLIFDCENSSTFTAKTNVYSAELNHRGVALTIDQTTDDLYAIFMGIAADSGFTDVGIHSRKSTDGGTTWEALSPRYNDSMYNQIRGLWSPSSISNLGGRIQPVWNFVNGPATVREHITNFDNGIAIQDTQPPPLPPPPIRPGGGSFTRGLSGGAGGFLTYVTPDGRLYPLHTPHDFGRWTISFSGFGTPPIQYITQRGPFQDGETVKDFFLRPRVIQLLIRQGFINRTAWWAGRADLLNEIRPNRQTTPTGAAPGQLRLVQTDGTIRDLNVFIAEGPRFEPRVSTQWDEHAFQEVLRFIAHDPVAFDPAQVTATFSITLSADLVFPITFPITFGGGAVDDTLNINYLGTWRELPVFTIVGPLEDVRIDNNTTGEKIELTADIGPGRTITIDLREGFKTVVDDLGNNLIGIVSSDSDLATFHLAPDPEASGGVNVIRLRGTNPTGTTNVSLAYFDRYFGF